MRALKFWCFFAIAFIPIFSSANHAAGGYFEYTYVGNNVYQVDFFFLRDCSGSPYPDEVRLDIKNSCGVSCYSAYAPAINSSQMDFGCGNACSSGHTQEDAPSFQFVQYRAQIALLTECSEWTVSTSINQRNVTDFSGDGEYYNYCIINNANDMHSSSADFGGYPVAIGCPNAGGLTKYTTTALSGTTLEYELVDALKGECLSSVTPVSHYPGLTANMPCPAQGNWQQQLDGSYKYVPTISGTGYFAVKVTARNALNQITSIQVIDGIVFTSSDCFPGSTIQFFSFNQTNGNVLTTNQVTTPLCGSFYLKANDTDESIVFASVAAPDFVTSSIVYNADGTATVYICADFPDELMCESADYSITVTAMASNAGCTAQAVQATPNKGYYYLHKSPGEYCPQNLFFTNRNSQSGIPMPLHAHAEERIWIGDNMPSFAPVEPAGPVAINGDAEYIAGIEIILPSCQTGTGCVTLSGDLTLKIAPNSCSAQCPHEEFDVFVHEYFKCSEERLEVAASGTPPFTYQLALLGDTIVQDQSGFYIHDLISQQDSGQVPYTMRVFDAAGNSGTFSGNILGTKRFYEPIINNKHYFHYPSGSPWGETGWYYDANLWIFSDTPAYWTDSTNTSPPWYGATEMWLTVWGSDGHPINDIRHNLELQDDGTGGEDWSLNQGEFWWSGKFNNGIWADCFEGQLTEMFPYVLKARNCYNDENIDMFVADIDEEASIWLLSCTDGDIWHPVEDKSIGASGDDNNDYAQYQKYTGHTRGRDITIESDSGTTFSLTPNPANEWIELTGDFLTVTDFIIIDQSGKTVLKKSLVSKDERIDVSSLTSGVYTIHCKTNEFTLQYKLIII